MVGRPAAVGGRCTGRLGKAAHVRGLPQGENPGNFESDASLPRHAGRVWPNRPAPAPALRYDSPHQSLPLVHQDMSRSATHAIRSRHRTPMRRLTPFLAAALALTACSDGGTGDAGPGPLASVTIVSGDAQSAVVGATVAQPLVVRAADAGGKPIANHPLVFVAVGGGRTYLGTAATNADGLASDVWTLGLST